MVDKEVIKKLLNPDYEAELVKFRELYEANKGLNKTNIKTALFELENSQKKLSLYREDALRKANILMKRELSPSTYQEYDKITRLSIFTKKSIEFHQKYKPRKATGNDFRDAFAELTFSNHKEAFCTVTDEELLNAKYSHKLYFLKQLYDCLCKYGLKDELIAKRSEIVYNIIIGYKKPNNKNSTDAVLCVSEGDLMRLYIKPYNAGDDIMVHGSRIEASNITTIQVTRTKYRKNEIALFMRRHKQLFDHKTSSSRVKFSKYCEYVTEEYINTETSILTNNKDYYIFPERLAELESISNPQFSLLKLVQLCKELNIAKKQNTLYTPAALFRAICDHIPPIFGYDSFTRVASEYKAEKNALSFQKSMKRLQETLRPVADTTMHSQIRAKESLPVPGQLDFAKDLDILLQEVCRLLK